ncbi:MAG: flagellar basal body L-ring protein FlgH [Desulfosarcina sp.]|nr:flagellar basal body L-ring protein FlgH [Desulfobacterales bacterium]
MIHGFKICLLAAFMLTILFAPIGCVTTNANKQTENIVKPVTNSDTYTAYNTADINESGSLWQDNGPLSELFIDSKARRVGDIVTIKIVESSSATNTASTKTGRKSSVAGGVDNFFNMEKRYPGTHPFFNPFAKVKGGLESDFDGSGTTKRSGDLTAFITTRVVEVLPNGNLKIEGTREVKVNNEKQLIRLSGIIRPRDISSENVILSTYVSDAKIEYSGSGIIHDRQRPGWMARILDIVWPF